MRPKTCSFRRRFCFFCFAIVAIWSPPETARSGNAPKQASESGFDHRIPWTGSRVVGSPDPPLPLRAVKAFPELKFDHPLYFLAEPASSDSSANTNNTPMRSERLFVVLQKGRIVGFLNDQNVESVETFLQLEDRDTYGMTFHPHYAEKRYVYVFSNGPNSNEKQRQNRVSRFNVSREAPFACDIASEKIIIEWESNGHNGGDLAFGPDGMLYISAGDGTTDSDTNLTGQKISDLVSGMLRIDVDHPAPNMGYSIPADNPFLDIPDARRELWAYGFRNPWRIHFDPQGNLWCGDIGQDQWEMIEIVRRGDNYGWSVVEGGHPFYLERQKGPHPIVAPAIVHPHSEARSITGGVTYSGSKFPEFRGAYIYGDYGTGKIWAARVKNGKIESVQEIADTPYQILGFGIDAAGEMYIVDYGGPLYTLERNPPLQQPEHFPRKLSATGLFQTVRGHVVDPALVPYSVNSPLWSDNAHKERFVALPGMSQVEFVEDKAWKFPEGTVLVKTFSLERELGKPDSARRIETRLLLFQQNEWVGYSYLWNDDETDAELVDSKGADRIFPVRDADSERMHKWHYPSRAECMVCHSRAAGFVLGLNTRQMNKLHDYGDRRANQLKTWEASGLLAKQARSAESAAAEPASEWKLPKPLEQFPALADPRDRSAAVEDRVRSYLHANCAQCHVEAGGGNSAMELGIATPREKTRILAVPPLHDRFGLRDALLIAPGAPERSVLLHRLSTRGRGQMPPLASELVDQAGVDLLREWISSLK